MSEVKQLFIDLYEEYGTDTYGSELELSELVWRLFSDDFWGLSQEVKDLVEAVEGEYGREGGGESCYGVIKYLDKYYKATWSYFSYNGGDYDYIMDTIKEVKPQQELVTVYTSV